VILTPLHGRRFRVYTRPAGDDADFVAEATAVLARYLRGSPVVARAGERLPPLGPVRAGEGEPERRLHELTHRTGHTLLVVAVGDAGDELARLQAHLEGLVARSPLFDAAFALATGADYLPYGSIHANAAAALGVESLAIFAIRPDRHVGLVAEPASLADVVAYEALVTGR
jgi:hypothetical protein